MTDLVNERCVACRRDAPHDALRLTDFVLERGIDVPGKSQRLTTSS